MTLTHANRLLKRAERLRRYGFALTHATFRTGKIPKPDTPRYAKGVRAHMLGEAAFWRAGGDREESRACLAAALAWRRREKAASA